MAGVNAAVEGWRGPWPPEFLVLGARPEPWTATQALAIDDPAAFLREGDHVLEDIFELPAGSDDISAPTGVN